MWTPYRKRQVTLRNTNLACSLIKMPQMRQPGDNENLCTAFDLLPYIPLKRNKDKEQATAPVLEMPNKQQVLVVDKQYKSGLDT